MKIYNLIIPILLVAFSFQGFAQSNDIVNLMDDLEGKEGVTSVVVTKKMFELFTKTTDIEVEGQSMNDIISGLDELKIISVGNWQPAAKNLKNQVNAIIKRDKFETLMKVVEHDERAEVYVLENNDVIKHLLMFVEDDNDSAYQLISITGIIDLENISKLSGTLNLDGLQYLDEDHEGHDH